jgi:inhibitor of KinA
MSSAPRLRLAGDRALVVEFGDAIDEATNRRVHAVCRTLDAHPPPGLIETVPTYRSLMIHYDPLQMSAVDLERAVVEADAQALDAPPRPGRVIEVPTVYGGPFGPDLADVAAHAGLSPDEVVALHAGGDYLVYMMGFMPGFPYLGGMSPRLATPRLGTPRTRVPAGSVGIAGPQTGIYPTDSPGGWRLIGRSPIRLFDPARQPPSLLDAGDTVRFVAVSEAAFAALSGDADARRPSHTSTRGA